jgi:diguanylate cyclase (GGDEF)-like protein
MEPLAALMCDLDHFKQINDHFGHAKGDEVLVALGAIFPSVLRGGDFAGHFGSEEFLALLPGTVIDGAVQTAERLRAAIALIRVPAMDQRITMSIGVAVIPDHATDAEGLERAADRALYSAKNKGRDRVEVVHFDEERSALDLEQEPARSEL